MATTLAEQWQRATVETLQQQQAVGQALAASADRREDHRSVALEQEVRSLVLIWP